MRTLSSRDVRVRATRILPLAGVLIAVLVASCGASPGLTVAVSGQAVPTTLTSRTDRTLCSASTGDAAVGDVPVTEVAPRPTLTLQGGGGTTGFQGAIYDVQEGAPIGVPIEEFTLSGATATYQLEHALAGKTYQVLVNVQWSFLVTSGSETHVFRLRIRQ